MKEKHILVQEIPAVLYGDSSESLFLYIHLLQLLILSFYYLFNVFKKDFTIHSDFNF